MSVALRAENNSSGRNNAAESFVLYRISPRDSDATKIGAASNAKRLDRFAQKGLDAGMLARIKAPIGLAIGAATPAEISVSILAQLTETLRNMGKS